MNGLGIKSATVWLLSEPVVVGLVSFVSPEWVSEREDLAWDQEPIFLWRKAGGFICVPSLRSCIVLGYWKGCALWAGTFNSTKNLLCSKNLRIYFPMNDLRGGCFPKLVHTGCTEKKSMASRWTIRCIHCYFFKGMIPENLWGNTL